MHEKFEDITIEEQKQIKELFERLQRDVMNLSSIDSIVDKLRHYTCYDVKNDELLDTLFVTVSTDNKEPNTLIGIDCFIDKENLTLSRFVDVFFNDEEYGLENYEVK